MNRSFFVMFFAYFFVVQSAIFGIVRGEPKFFVIGLINLIFIVLMALFYKHFDASSTSTHNKKESSGEVRVEHAPHAYHSSLYASKKQSSPVISYLFVISIILLFLIVLDKAFLNILPFNIWLFAGFYFVMLFLSAKKLLDKKIVIGDTIFLPKDFLFWTSLVVVIGVYGTLTMQLLAFKLLFSACVGFIFFFIGANIVKDLGSSNMFKLFFTRFYLLLITVLLLIIGIQSFSSSYKAKLASDWSAVGSLFSNGFSFTSKEVGDTFTGADLLSNGTGQVLSSSLSVSGADIPLAGDMYSGELLTGEVSMDVLPSSGTIEDIPDDAIVVDDRLDIPLYPTLMDTLIYLMNHYGVSLSTQKNMSFTYVTPKNPYYAQFKTAYEMKLIGKDANPSKRVLCETYMVMKGLIEGWSVPHSADIKRAYWNEATSRAVLNGCKRNFYVRNVNL